MIKQSFFLFLGVSILSVIVLIGCEEMQTLAPENNEATVSSNTHLPVTENQTEHGVASATADVFGQGPDGPVVAEDGAVIRRTSNGISIQLTMPTPKTGEYAYPTEGEAFSGPGHPEVFSLWAFVFNNPPADDWDGAFAVAGHVVGGSTLTLSGNISLNTEPFLGDKLENPEGAEVHLAVAPHGALSPDLLPEALRTPTGPGPEIWWIAQFEGEE